MCNSHHFVLFGLISNKVGKFTYSHNINFKNNIKDGNFNPSIVLGGKKVCR